MSRIKVTVVRSVKFRVPSGRQHFESQKDLSMWLSFGEPFSCRFIWIDVGPTYLDGRVTIAALDDSPMPICS